MTTRSEPGNETGTWASGPELRTSWWREGVLYQIYPRSWADSNGDGIGDLRGILERLDYLAWLGIDGIWLNPTMASPNQDWGYDVSDYCSVDPDLGAMADLDALIREARRRGMAVLLDLVPNHTSDRHPWFLDSRSSATSRHRDWYVWASSKPDGSPPNNWTNALGDPAWTLEETGQYYLHNFLPSQPDLNWWNEDVRAAFDGIIRFWFDRGVAGFRIDTAHLIVKDQELRDNPPASDGGRPVLRRLRQRRLYNADRPEVHDVLRRWRALSDAYQPPRVLIGETYLLDFLRVAPYCRPDELHLAFNFPFLLSPLEAGPLQAAVELAESALPPEAWAIWTGSNHDHSRFPTRWCGGQPAKMRLVLLMLLTLRGTPLLYYGDEIGMEDVHVGPGHARDRLGARDPFRTPMRWNPRPGAGFTDPRAEPWLPLGSSTSPNVEDQRADPRSVLSFCRDLIALRRRLPELQTGAYETLPAGEHVFAWRRGTRALVTLNFSDERTMVPGVEGTIAISTSRERDGERVAKSLQLEGWEGAVVLHAGSSPAPPGHPHERSRPPMHEELG